MKHRPITTTANALQFYCNSLDADKKISVEIATWLTSLNSAQSIVSQNEIDLAQAVENGEALNEMHLQHWQRLTYRTNLPTH